MEKKPYIRPVIKIIVIDIKELLADLKVSGQTGHTVDDWDGKETDFDDENGEGNGFNSSWNNVNPFSNFDGNE